MSKLWDDLKKNMKDWGDAAVEKAEEVSKIAVAKTEEITRISKIKIENHQLSRDISAAYEKLGRLSHKHAQEENMVNFTGNTEFYQIVSRINDIQSAIDEKNAEIERIKKEYDLEEEDITAAEEIDAPPPEADRPAESE